MGQIISLFYGFSLILSLCMISHSKFFTASSSVSAKLPYFPNVIDCEYLSMKYLSCSFNQTFQEIWNASGKSDLFLKEIITFTLNDSVIDCPNITDNGCDFNRQILLPSSFHLNVTLCLVVGYIKPDFLGEILPRDLVVISYKHCNTKIFKFKRSDLGKPFVPLVKSYNVSSNSALFSFQDIENQAISAKLFSDSSSQIADINSTYHRDSFKIRNLLPFTNYTIQFAANFLNDDNHRIGIQSDWSKKILIATKESLPDAPSFVSFIRSADDNVTIVWKGLSRKQRKGEMKKFCLLHNGKWIFVSPNTREYRLPITTKVEVEIAAENGAGKGSSSHLVVEKTENLSEKPILHVYKIGSALKGHVLLPRDIPSNYRMILWMCVTDVNVDNSDCGEFEVRELVADAAQKFVPINIVAKNVLSANVEIVTGKKSVENRSGLSSIWKECFYTNTTGGIPRNIFKKDDVKTEVKCSEFNSCQLTVTIINPIECEDFKNSPVYRYQIKICENGNKECKKYSMARKTVENPSEIIVVGAQTLYQMEVRPIFDLAQNSVVTVKFPLETDGWSLKTVIIICSVLVISAVVCFVVLLFVRKRYWQKHQKGEVLPAVSSEVPRKRFDNDSSSITVGDTHYIINSKDLDEQRPLTSSNSHTASTSCSASTLNSNGDRPTQVHQQSQIALRGDVPLDAPESSSDPSEGKYKAYVTVSAPTDSEFGTDDFDDEDDAPYQQIGVGIDDNSEKMSSKHDQRSLFQISENIVNV